MINNINSISVYCVRSEILLNYLSCSYSYDELVRHADEYTPLKLSWRHYFVSHLGQCCHLVRYKEFRCVVNELGGDWVAE